MLLSVAFVSASSTSTGSEPERAVCFYVVPLAFVGLALWIEQGLPRPRTVEASRWRPLRLLLRSSDPQARLQRGLQALALLPSGHAPPPPARAAIRRGDRPLRPSAWQLLRRTTGASGARRRLDGAVGLFAVSRIALGVEDCSGVRGAPATWIDDAMPEGRTSPSSGTKSGRAELPDSFYFWLMVTEFFNRSVGTSTGSAGYVRTRTSFPLSPRGSVPRGRSRRETVARSGPSTRS